MRNLREHPVTLGEIIDTLSRDAERIRAESDGCGDMRPMIYAKAVTILRRLDFALSEVGRD